MDLRHLPASFSRKSSARAVRTRLRRWLKWTLLAAAFGTLAATVPVVWVEMACVGPQEFRSDYTPILEPAHRREEINTYLTYPEWSIVHAYEDYAGVVRARGESAFAYFSSIGGYWRNFCGMARYASARGSVPGDVRVMLHVIGLSFAAEMGAKGLYEVTVGGLTEWVRGQARTPEDRFALAVSEDYARFLNQTPWYAYPFGATLRRFWSETPWSEGNLVRKVERRFILSLEYGFKALYAKAIGALAGLAPASLRIRSVVRGLDETDLAADRRIQIVGTGPNGATIIETPRYREFTEVLAGLANRGREVVEIAGNDDIFVTVLVSSAGAAAIGARLVEVPVQANLGWRRIGVAVKVDALASFLRDLRKTNARIEHVYDY